MQGGFDATCGLFYAGVWASSLDLGHITAAPIGNNAASIEMDWYVGIKPKTGRITWDLGVIYYTYPELDRPGCSAAATATTSSSRSAAAPKSGRTARWA